MGMPERGSFWGRVDRELQLAMPTEADSHRRSLDACETDSKLPNSFPLCYPQSHRGVRTPHSPLPHFPGYWQSWLGCLTHMVT